MHAGHVRGNSTPSRRRTSFQILISLALSLSLSLSYSISLSLPFVRSRRTMYLCNNNNDCVQSQRATKKLVNGERTSDSRDVCLLVAVASVFIRHDDNIIIRSSSMGSAATVAATTLPPPLPPPPGVPADMHYS